MLASRRYEIKDPGSVPKLILKKDLEKEMDRNEVIESLAIYFYNSILKNQTPKIPRRKRSSVLCTSPSIFNSTDIHVASPTILEIRNFIETIFEKRRLAAESGVVALVLFSRAGVKVNSSNWMRLILVILLLANKEAEDVYSVWNVRFVGIIPNLPVYEINLLEMEFLKYLKYRLHVEKPTYKKFYKQLLALLPEKSVSEDLRENLMEKKNQEIFPKKRKQILGKFCLKNRRKICGKNPINFRKNPINFRKNRKICRKSRKIYRKNQKN